MHSTGFDASRGGCPCCFIIPPHMLQHLATSGDPDLAATAGRTLRLTQSLVAFRAQLSTGAPSPAAPKRAGRRRQVFDCKGPPTCRAIPSAQKPIPHPAGTGP
jgi:hypothetical protein